MDFARYKSLIAESGRHFTADTTGHTMTVLRDDGLYGHLRFREHRLIVEGPGRG